MRKISITFLIFAIIIVSILGITATANSTNQEYLRIHIRANSNSQIDQSVKLEIKEKIVSLLTPVIAESKTKTQAEKNIKGSLGAIEECADKILLDKGFSYKSRAKLTIEEFPTRTYGSLTLEAGFYDALILELGDGEGDNWWCVVYPPLCFTVGGVSYVYKSKIYEIINGFFNKEK